MPKVKCKVCHKVWEDVGSYANGKGCTSDGCPHNKKPAMNAFIAEKRPNLQHVKTGAVISSYDKTKDCRFLEVPKVISVHIFPRKGKR